MKKTSETVVFFGSGPVAARSLELLAKHFKVEAVITKPKPLDYKGHFPVLDTAEKLKLPILTVADRVSLDELMATNPVSSRLAILIDFGIIISQEVIDYFPLGIVNSHFSLLPKLRGADPITFAILNGERETGVSLMLVNAKMDEGPLLAQAPYKLTEEIATPELTEDLIDLSNQMLQTILPLYVDGQIRPVTQGSTTAPTYSRKLTKKDGIIDWHKPAIQLEREIRAFIEWPKSRTQLAGKEVILTEARVVDISGEPGSIETNDKQLVICCGEQALRILTLKPAGKPVMTAEAFLAGHRLT